jgi:hypothetical protein
MFDVAFGFLPHLGAPASPRERLAAVLELEPGLRPTASLVETDAGVLSPGQRVDLLVALTEQQAWLEAARVRVLAEIENADETELGLSQETVALALRVSVRAAQSKLKTARALTRELPLTMGLLAAGKISARHAELIAERTWSLDPELVGVFESAVLEKAPEQTVKQLQDSVRRTAMRLDPVTAQARHERALAGRRVGFQPCEDGMDALPVLLGAVEGQLIFTRLTTAAKLLPAKDPRSMDQKRADLLVDAVLTGLPHNALPELQGRRPSIQVVVSADTLLRLDDEPAHSTGYGPITAHQARRLAADQSGTWRRLLTDPDTGQLLDISQDHYRPSQRLRDFVAARDSVCVHPGCNQPGYLCEYDHTIPYLQAGRTCRCNLALLCRRHNQCKIDTGWTYHFNPDSSFTWTTPTGHTYTSHPPERWTRREDRHEPEPRKQKTLHDIRDLEDTEYDNLRHRWQTELDLAEQAGDQSRITNAHKALTAMTQARHIQLAHRANPHQPPS